MVQKIRHKHTLARNYFSKMSTMENYFKHAENPNASDPNDVFDENEEEDADISGSIVDSTTPNSVSVSTMID